MKRVDNNVNSGSVIYFLILLMVCILNARNNIATASRHIQKSVVPASYAFPTPSYSQGLAFQSNKNDMRQLSGLSIFTRNFVIMSRSSNLYQNKCSFSRLSSTNTNSEKSILHDDNGKWKEMDGNEILQDLLNPADFCKDGKIPYPKHLSPSSAMEFMECPQSYLFQYLYKIKQPPNLALAKGTMCHTALEQIFNYAPVERTGSNLHNLFRMAWRDARQKPPYNELFQKNKSTQSNGLMHSNHPETTNLSNGEKEDWDYDAEREWGKSALNLLSNYVKLEDPRLVAEPNPMEREIWVNAKLSTNPMNGATGYMNKFKNDEGQTKSSTSDNNDTFLVRGIVDRIDMISLPNGQVVKRIVDYKTGKAPDFKYTPEVNRRIANANFFQLKIYALLLRETYNKHNESSIQDDDVRLLRLLYLTSLDGQAHYLDMDLGESQESRDELLQEVHDALASIWKQIHDLVDTQDPRSFHHCNRPFCFCHKTRPKFIPGSVYSRESP